MKIAFILPGHGGVPVGGFKVVYEYANGLIKLNHEVSVYHSARIKSAANYKSTLKRLIGYFLYLYTGWYKPTSWFKILPRVKLKWIPEIENRYLDDEDVYISTTCDVAERLHQANKALGKHATFIQGLETFNKSESYVYENWRCAKSRYFIANWLADIAKTQGMSGTVIYNGLDHQSFYLTNPFSTRNEMSFLFLLHPSPWKGSKMAIEVLSKLKLNHPHLKVTAFSAYERPNELPHWIDFVQQPSPSILLTLYNSHRFFLSCSTFEGWALGPAEAMQCGAVCILSEIPGHSEYASFDRPAIYFRSLDASDCYRKCLEAMKNSNLQEQLSKRALESTKCFNWGPSTERFAKVLKEDFETT